MLRDELLSEAFSNRHIFSKLDRDIDPISAWYPSPGSASDSSRFDPRDAVEAPRNEDRHTSSLAICRLFGKKFCTPLELTELWELASRFATLRVTMRWPGS
jgi:hypothetical protein